MKNYNIVKFNNDTDYIESDWDSSFWNNAEEAVIENYREESKTFEVKSKIKLQYSEQGIYGIFHSDEMAIRAEVCGHNSGSCDDSCVEFFVKPSNSTVGYLNFEFTPLGFVHCSHVIDWRRPNGDIQEKKYLTDEDIKCIRIESSFEKASAHDSWSLAFFIPFKLLKKYFDFDEKNLIDDQNWTVNFYKCGDLTEEPHWIAWNPVHELNFHLPECFGKLSFK